MMGGGGAVMGGAAGMGAAGMGVRGVGLVAAQGPNDNCCAVGGANGQGCNMCGIACGGGGQGAMAYVGTGHGEYIQETNYKYVGVGGDFDVVRPRRDFTCLIVSFSLLSLLLLIPLLLWLMAGNDDFTCNLGVDTSAWSQQQRDYCCRSSGLGCATTLPATAFPPPRPTQPPTQPSPNRPQPNRPVDPFNCAVDPQPSWAADKKAWCCRIHHLGCPITLPPTLLPPVQPTVPPPAPDPYNCADGYANWQVGWSVGKKEWCCRVHGKGCNDNGGGCAPGTTPAPALPYDCNAGFANWVAGWSVAKKDWCCKNSGKGCPAANGGCA